MGRDDGLAARFEEHRAYLRAMAYRMLGSPGEADDAVQETWIRLQRSAAEDVDNLRAWLTTVTARVCLTMLQSRRSRREEPLDTATDAPPAGPTPEATDPEHQAVLADSVGVALLVVLDTLTPAERLAFVLHDIFAVPFDQIASVVDRTPAAARQLASRARRRVRGTTALPEADPARQRQVVTAFLTACRDGDFAALLDVLDPDAVLRADPAAEQAGSPRELRGGEAVARLFCGLARAAQPVLLGGTIGATWAPGGRPRVVLRFTLTSGRITAIDITADPDRIRRLAPVILDP